MSAYCTVSCATTKAGSARATPTSLLLDRTPADAVAPACPARSAIRPARTSHRGYRKVLNLIRDEKSPTRWLGAGCGSGLNASQAKKPIAGRVKLPDRDVTAMT